LKTATSSFDPDQHLNLARREAKQTLNPNSNPNNSSNTISANNYTEEELQPKIVQVPESKPQKSFFDEIQ
jgi:hypothetical protein